MGEFSPVQLDALEDALENLELSGIPGELDGDLAVAGRLGEYRDLLVLSREALPAVDVPAGILDGVLAAAREEAVIVPDAAGEARADDAATPWWQRVSVWMPMLAVGASAALVLIVVRGTMFADAEPASTVARADAKSDDTPAEEARAAEEAPGALLDDADALQAMVEPAANADEDDGLALGGLEQRGRLRGSGAFERGPSGRLEGEQQFETPKAERKSAESERPAEPEPAVAPEPTDKVVYGEKSKGAAKKKSSSGTPEPKKPSGSVGPKASSGGAPGGVPDAPKDADPLASAERDRKRGRCGAARSVYRAHLDDSDASLRARALAGMGLCALADGDEAAADDYFERATTADGGVGSFIAAERATLERTADQGASQSPKK